jgi:hypothetical protein
LKIFPLDIRTESTLRSFIAGSLFNPYAIYKVSDDRFFDYFFSELSDGISKGDLVLVAKEDNELVGLISLTRSEWDSKHFGIKISKINQLVATGDYLKSLHIKRRLISSLIEMCNKELLLHVSARVNKEDLSSIHALESKYFRLMDILVTYFLDYRKHPLIHNENRYNIRKFVKSDVPILEQLALDCFHNSAVVTDRFHADPTLPKVKSGELYSKWVFNSCNDPFSEVLVAEIDGKPIGFNVCSINPTLSNLIGLRVGTLALTAVNSSARNKLVATSLLNASIAWFADKVDVIETGGQASNYAIQRTWNTVGMKITRVQCTFHWSILTENI